LKANKLILTSYVSSRNNLSKRETKSKKVSFSKEEVKFLNENKLARLATVSKSGQPHVVPIGYKFEDGFFYFGGYSITKSLKFRNIQQSNKVGLVVDDLISTNPWTPRFIIMRGTAEIFTEKGPGSIDERTSIKITPLVKRSTFTR
jgi:pyridoxamine 5'-phosphate oxidase family protein